MNKIFTWEAKIIEEVSDYLRHDSTGHDLSHSQRVRRFCESLAKAVIGDIEILVAASYLHDIGRPCEVERGSHVAFALERVPTILKNSSFPHWKIEKVLEVIEFHEHYSFLGHQLPENLCREVLIFQDADRLDAIGAIGLARVFMFSGANKIKLWDGDVGSEKWSPAINSRTAIGHLQSKILRLEASMNFGYSKSISAKRTEFIMSFCEEFFEEWNAGS